MWISFFVAFLCFLVFFAPSFSVWACCEGSHSGPVSLVRDARKAELSRITQDADMLARFSVCNVVTAQLSKLVLSGICWTHIYNEALIPWSLQFVYLLSLISPSATYHENDRFIHLALTGSPDFWIILQFMLHYVEFHMHLYSIVFRYVLFVWPEEDQKHLRRTTPSWSESNRWGLRSLPRLVPEMKQTETNCIRNLGIKRLEMLEMLHYRSL